MIIVTGASRGIGGAVYNSLKQNYEVYGLSKSESTDPNIFKCDISDFNSIKSIVNKFKKKGSLYALINVAGIASMNLALATPPEKTKQIINTNLLGTIFTNQIFSPLIIRNKGGRIINFSTLAVRIGIKGEAIYVASKAGVEAFSRCLAKELHAFNVTVNCIAPGPIKTDLLRGVTDKQIENMVNRQIFEKICEPQDIVDQVNLLLSPQANKVTGQVIHVGGA